MSKPYITFPSYEKIEQMTLNELLTHQQTMLGMQQHPEQLKELVKDRKNKMIFDWKDMSNKLEYITLLIESKW